MLLSSLPDRLIDPLPILLLRPTLIQKYAILCLQKLLHPRLPSRPHRPPRLAHPLHDAPQPLPITGRLGPQHGRAVNHSSMHIPRNQHGHVARRRHEVHENPILALAARHPDARNRVAGTVHRLDNLPRLQRDELHGGVVQQRHGVAARVGAHADERAAHAGVGDGRAVAPEVAVEEEVAAEVRDGRRVRFGGEVVQVVVEEVVDVLAGCLGGLEGFAVGGVRLEHVLQELAGGGLASLGHPEPGEEHVPVRTPYSGHEDGVLGHGEVAGGRPGHGGEPGEGLGHIVGSCRLVEGARFKLHLGADSPNPPGVRINDAASDGDARR